MFHPIRRCFSFIAHVSSSSALFRLHRSRLRQSLVDSKIPKYVSPNQFIRLSYAKQKRSGIADNSEDIPDLTGCFALSFCIIALRFACRYISNRVCVLLVYSLVAPACFCYGFAVSACAVVV
ncbi:uncharacterized protein LOC127106699 isoform X2 [Lathyrus oleraceus]|uniref:uncharacterized protein LOC127106699 isoform X2 n=1 Tax=Pisum sativum TaxID=3888 RepID=UPI0021D2B73C|nr:uncharacterized protein LOC127106699 isoform X2 [Pisum sativum]